MGAYCRINSSEFKELENVVGKNIAYKELARSIRFGTPLPDPNEVLANEWSKGRMLNKKPDSAIWEDNTYGMKSQIHAIPEYAVFNDTNFKSIAEFNKRRVADDVIRTIAENFSKRLNVNYEIISEEDARTITASLPPNLQYQKGDEAFFLKGKVYLVQGNITLSGVFHEFSHPFIRAIRKGNPELFEKLFNDINESNKGFVDNIFKRYEGLSEEDKKEEVIVSFIENYSTNKDYDTKENKTIIEEILYQIRKLLRKLIGRNVRAEKLSLNTTVKELADILNGHDDINIDTSFLSEDDIIAYKRAYDKEIQELTNVANNPEEIKRLTGLINDTYRSINRILYNIKNKNSYKEFEDLFATLYSKNELEKIKILLREARELPLESDIEKIHNQATAFVESLGVMDTTIGRISDELSKLSKSVNNKEDLRRAYYLMNLLKNYKRLYEEYNKMLQQNYIGPYTAIGRLVNNGLNAINAAETYSSEIYKEAGSEAIYSILSTYSKAIDDKYNSLMEYYDKINAPERLRQQKTAEYKSLRITKEKINELLSGRGRDAHFLNSYVESYMNNQDPIVFGLALHVKNAYTDAFNNAYSKTQMLAQELSEQLKNVNYDKNDPRAFFSQITYVDQNVKFKPGEDEESSTFAVRKFLNPWMNWELKKQQLNVALSRARESGNKEELDKAYKERAEHLTKYFHDEYTPEYYAIRNSLRNDEVGEIAYERLKEIDKKIKDVQKLYENDGFLSPETQDELEQYLKQRKFLFSLYDEFGNEKEGIEKQISEKLKNYRELKNDLYTERINHALFEHSYNEFLESIQGLSEKEQQEKIDQWSKANLSFKLTADFYQERSLIYEEIEELRRQYKTLVDIDNESAMITIAELYDEMNKIMYQHRDTNGQPDGTEMTPEKIARIKELHNLIEIEKEALVKNNGLTREENEFLKEYNDKVTKAKYYRDGVGPTNEEKQRYLELTNKKIYFRGKRFNKYDKEKKDRLLRAQRLKEKIIEKYGELNELQTNTFTPQYVDVFMNWIDELRTFVLTSPPRTLSLSGKQTKESKEFAELYKKATGLLDTIDAMLETDYSNISELIAYMHENESLLSRMLNISTKRNGLFTKWFIENHYKVIATIRDETTGEYKTVPKYRPIKAWMNIVPNNEEHIEKTTINLRDGSTKTFIGIPTAKYKVFEIKDKYKTKKITILEAIEAGDITKANYDEFNNTWLPRLDVNDSPYINKAFMSLKENDKPKYDILMTLIKFHLENQKGHDLKDMLGFEIPRFRARSYEKVKYVESEIDEETGELKNVSRLSRFMEELKSFFKKRPDDVERDFNPDEAHYALPTSLFDEYDDKLIVRGKYDIDMSEVSWDIFETLTMYMQSLERKKVLKELNPLARGLQKVLADNNFKEVKEIMSGAGVVSGIFLKDAKKDRYIRKKAIDNFIEREFESITQKGPWADSQPFQTVANSIQKLSAFNMFALNFNSALKNSLGAKIQGLIESAGATHFTPVDYSKGIVWANEVMAELSFGLYKLDSKSEKVQIMQLFDMVTGRSEETLGDQLDRTLVKDIVNNPMGIFTNFRKWGEQNSEVSIAAAILIATKIERIIDGKVTLIPYIEAWEKDTSTGLLKLKSGISEDYGLNGEKFKLIKNKIASVTNDVNGAFSKFDEVELDRYVIWRALTFLRKWFTRMFINRFGARNLSARNLFTPNGWANLQERHDVGKNETSMGFYMRALRTFSILLQNGVTNWHLLEKEDKYVFARIGMDILTMVVAWFVITFILGYDPEDPDRYKKLRQKSGPLPTFFTADSEYDFHLGGYLSNHITFLLMGMKQEQLQWIPFPGFGLEDYKELLQMQPIMLSNTLNTGTKFLTGLTNWMLGDDRAYYQRTVGPYEWQQKESAKMFNYLGKTFGLSGTQVDPVLAIKNFVSVQAIKGS